MATEPTGKLRHWVQLAQVHSWYVREPGLELEEAVNVCHSSAGTGTQGHALWLCVERGTETWKSEGHATSEMDPTDLRSSSVHSSFCRHLFVRNGVALHQVPVLRELSDFAMGDWLW